MPIYEFRCNNCERRVSLFVRSIASSLSPQCPYCGNPDMARLISSFAHHKSAHGWLEEAGPPQAAGGPDYYKDPRNIGRWTEHRLKQLGMDMRSEEYSDTFSEVRHMIDAAREGEMPEPIKDL
jgi:putative FmdB family regulatory protein